MGVFQTMPISFGHFPLENSPTFPAQEPEKFPHFRRYFMKTGLTKKQKVTEVYYNAKDPTAEIYTHDTKLKKRLLAYSAQFPELCQQTDDNEQGGLTFEIKKGRLSFRLTAPYSAERRKIYSKNAKEKGMKGSAEYSFEIKKIT